MCVWGEVEMGEEEGREYARESRSLKTVYVWHQQYKALDVS